MHIPWVSDGGMVRAGQLAIEKLCVTTTWTVTRVSADLLHRLDI